MALTAEEICRCLNLQPHPEGGFYVETFRDNQEASNIGDRGHSTAIYFLLQRDKSSAWRRVKDAAEVWHWYGGAPLTLTIGYKGMPHEIHRLGIDLINGERPQAVVPAGCWQTAQTLGSWTLVGCTVAPGFDIAQSELAGTNWEI